MTICVLCLMILSACSGGKVRQVACVGDSITAEGYPDALAELLGEKYIVTNFGRSGSRVRSGTAFSYTGMDEYQESLALQADIYIIMLGSNDSFESAEWDEEKFRADYEAFLDSYIEGCPDAKIYTMICPAIDTEASTISAKMRDDILYDYICPIIAEISEKKGIEAIDLLSLTLEHPEWSDDGIHPNEEGKKGIAEYIYSVIR